MAPNLATVNTAKGNGTQKDPARKYGISTKLTRQNIISLRAFK